MPLLVIVGIFLFLSSLPSLESVSYAVALTLSLALLWSRSRELALPRELVSLLTVPLLLLCIVLHGVYTHPLADFLKDCWYFTLPVVYLSTGYLVFERVGQWQRLIQPLILAGLAIGGISLVHAVLHRDELTAAASVDAYRAVTGNGTFVPMLPLIAVLLARRAQLPAIGAERWAPMRILIYTVSVATILSSFSRVHILMLLAGVACTLSFRSVLRRTLQGGGLVLVLISLGIAVGGYALANAKSGPVELFFSKIANTGSEVQVRPYETFEEINNNWRGYEAYRAAKTYGTYSVAEKIFGGGGGALVDLGFAMQLSATQAFQYIPTTHNGYMYLLVKTGIVGLVLFAVLAIQLWVIARRMLRIPDRQATFAGLALLWTPLVIVATQGVITGIYNKGELTPILFLTGAAVATYAQRRRVLEEAAIRQFQKRLLASHFRASSVPVTAARTS